MRGRLGAYAAWQARDFVFERGFPMLIVSTLMLFPVFAITRVVRRQAPEGIEVGEMVLSALLQTMPILGFALVILAVNGLVSNDRHRGYFRFLFSKPISLVRYYVQAFLISGAGVLLVGLLILLLFYTLAYPILPLGMLAFLGLYFIGLGGLCFLFSSVFRTDWILVAGLWTVASILRALYPAEESWYGRVFHVIMPPFHLASGLSESLVRGQAVVVSDVIWLSGYGLGAFMLGLLLLRWRPLAA